MQKAKNIMKDSIKKQMCRLLLYLRFGLFSGLDLPEVGDVEFLVLCPLFLLLLLLELEPGADVLAIEGAN